MKSFYIAILSTSMFLCQPHDALAAGKIVGSANAISNGLSKEIEPDKEIITYGSFKVGAFRDAYDIPINYGELVEITYSNTGSITFWFVDKDRTIRNVSLGDINPDKPLVIHRNTKFTLE